MKRQKIAAESLVYAYGCGQPQAGLLAAEAEQERCAALWDRLVEIERTYDREIEMAAASDVPQIAQQLADIETLRDKLRLASRDERAAAIRELRAVRAAIWQMLSAWRKAHPDRVREIEAARRARVVEARQTSRCWWPNYNAVIQRYETARIEVRRKGRRLRQTDIERDDGCLSVQIQRTLTGLGAAPGELHDGTVSMLAIGQRIEARDAS